MIPKFVAVQVAERLVEAPGLGIISDAALEVIQTQGEILPLPVAAHREARFLVVVHRGHTGVVCHVPGGIFPEIDVARGQRGHSAEEEVHPTVLGALPLDVGLDPEHISHEGPKPTERREEAQLAQTITQGEVELGLAKGGRPVLTGQRRLRRPFQQTKNQQQPCGCRHAPMEPCKTAPGGKKRIIRGRVR